MTDLDLTLFDIQVDPTRFLRDRYGEPPFSVLDRRGPAWVDRDRKWTALGIQSELGRAEGLAYRMAMDYPAEANPSDVPSTSVFSPTLCELVYRWYTRPGGPARRSSGTCATTAGRKTSS